jgi:hypothetical protein
MPVLGTKDLEALVYGEVMGYKLKILIQKSMPCTLWKTGRCKLDDSLKINFSLDAL